MEFFISFFQFTNNLLKTLSLLFSILLTFSFIKERLSWAIEKGYVKKCDPDLCAFIIYKVYVAVMFEWDKEIDENEVTQNVTQILKEGLFN